MDRNAKMLSAIAVAVALAAIALVVFVQLQPAVGDRAGGAGLSPAAVMPPHGGAVAAGRMAADFTLKDLSGKTISLSSLRGKVVFLNVWATWCAPCREEMPSIEALYERFRPHKDFVVFAVSQDTDTAVVAPYMRRNGYKFDALLDPQNVVGEAYNVSGIPETFIIGRDGRIVAHHVGPYDWSTADIGAALKELIEAKTG